MSATDPGPGWWYQPGEHWAVIGPSAAAFLVDESKLDLARRIWALLGDAPGGVERVLDEMTHDGVAGLPPFVLVEVTEEGLRALVRGPAEARLRSSTGGASRTVSGTGFRTWREEVVPDLAEAVIAPAGAPASGEPELPLHSGIVRAAALRLELSATVDGDPAPLTAQEPAPPPVVDPSLTLDQSDFEAADEAEASPPPTPAVPAEEPVAVPAPAAEDDDYLELVAGVTRMGSVEDAAVRPPADVPPRPDHADPDVPPTLVRPAVTREPAPQPPAPPPASPPAPPPPAAPAAPRRPGLISSVPFLSGRSAARPAPEPAPAPPRATEQPGRHAPRPPVEAESELTIVRVPAGSAGETGGVSATPRAGWLPAVICSRGHANPPEADSCRTCREDLARAEQSWVERPVVGQLRFDGPPGVIPVAGPMIIGRAPRVDRVSGDAVPTMVTVPNPERDVSGSHLRIAVEGWHVMVVDLDATNGTVVVDPSGESRRLRPGEEKMIIPGTRVVLADTIGFVFEALP
jgi:hypothetical protein